MPKLDPELKAKWVAALRSGEYKQTNGYLIRPEGHCCIGVLCDIIGPDDWQLSLNGLSVSWRDIANNNIFSSQPSLPIDHTKLRELSERNDAGATFAEIADIIEADDEI